MDEVFIRIADIGSVGARCQEAAGAERRHSFAACRSPGRAALPLARGDQDGVVLDILVQARRDAQAATRFFKRLLTGLQYQPRVIATVQIVSASPRLPLRPLLHLRHFRPRRRLLPARLYREVRLHAFNVRHQETCTRNAA
jgi:hypothetical protein